MEAVCAECQINETAADKCHETRRREPRPWLGTPDLEGSKTLDQQQKSSWVRRSLHSRGLKIWTNYNRIFCFSSDEADSTEVKSREAGEAREKTKTLWATYKCQVAALHRFWPSSGWYLGRTHLSIGGLNIFSICKRVIWTTPTDTSKWAGQTKEHQRAHLPHVYDPRVIVQCRQRALWPPGSTSHFRIVFCCS